MNQILIICTILISALADCPVGLYPYNTVTGTIIAQIDNDPNQHGTSLDYKYSLYQDLPSSSISTAIGILGVQFNPKSLINFLISHSSSSDQSAIRFKVLVNDGNFGWRSIRFNFFATPIQSPIFNIFSETVTQFSGGLSLGKFSIYRPIQRFTNFEQQPILKLYLRGITLKAKPLDDQYNNMVAQYDSFRKFSTNTRLINSFAEAIQLKKSLSFKINEIKILGKLYSISFQTNSDVSLLAYSIILISQLRFTQKHNFAAGEFSYLNNDEFKFNGLQNMGMTLTGLQSFKFPRDNFYSYSLKFSNLGGQNMYELTTNYQYLEISLAYFAAQLKMGYACQNCPNNNIVFENKYCVDQCPRGFSLSTQGNVKFCDRCDIQKIKVVNSQGICVCAVRHFLDISQDICKPCSYDCMSCSQAEKCLTCDNNLGQTKRKLSLNGRCQCPTIGFYDDKSSQNIVCQKCNPKCLTCNGPYAHDCLTCDSNRQLDLNKFCICKNGFVEDLNGNCGCPSPKFISQGNCMDLSLTCSLNQIQQVINQIKKCVCKPGFISVKNDCIKCGQNSIFNQELMKCQCQKQTIQINGQCIPCGNNQVYDEVYKICVCSNGFYKKNDGSCISCPPKMALINDQCQCIYNYYEASPKVCRPCKRQTDGPRCVRNIF